MYFSVGPGYRLELASGFKVFFPLKLKYASSLYHTQWTARKRDFLCHSFKEKDARMKGNILFCLESLLYQCQSEELYQLGPA